MVGTFLLTFVSGWSRMTVEVMSMDYMENALVMGLLFSALAMLALTTSGGHYNPMITISLMIVSQVSMPKGLSYIIAHMIGSLLGGGMLAYTASVPMIDASRAHSVLGMPRISHNFSQNSAFFCEFMGSALIMCMYWTSLKEVSISPQVKGYLNGVAVTIATIVFYQVSGACFNPMLIFGPSLISRTLRDYHWIYYFGPLMGCFTVAVVLDTMEKTRDVVMNKKKIVKAKVEEVDIEMEQEDVEWEQKKALERQESMRRAGSIRQFEISEDEVVEDKLGEIKEEEYDHSDHELDEGQKEKRRLEAANIESGINDNFSELKGLQATSVVREKGKNDPLPQKTKPPATDSEQESD